MTGNNPTRSIGKKVIWSFCWFSILISAAFSFMGFMLLFIVEDEFLERTLNAERDRLVEAYQLSGKWQQPGQANMEVHTSPETLPDDMRYTLLEEPKRREFYGAEGRHYHITDLADGAILLAEVSEELLVRPMRRAILTLYGVLALMLMLVGAFVAYRIARHSIGPLISLADLVKHTEPEKLPDGFANEYPNNEVGTLATALQTALRRIARFIKREQNFTRDVSHDLRTPIAVVSGAVEVLKKRHKLDGEQAQLLDRIDTANQHMARTVEALLSLAREEDKHLLKETISLLPVVEKSIVQLSHFLDGKDVEVDVVVSPTATLSLQPGVLEVLLSNLLGNAFQYTQQGTVSISYKNSSLIISDTGSGVEEDLQNHMFEDHAKGRDSSGFGLGLSIVKRVCEHHDIDIRVQSGPEGTTICLTFEQ